MVFSIDARPSDSPFVNEIWRARSERAGSFVSIAATQWEMVVTRHHGKLTTLTVRGPETTATPLSYPEDGEWCGIRFRVGTFLPPLPVGDLVDRGVSLPEAGSQSFWLQGAAWQFPDYENADTFVDRLVREGILAHDPVVETALKGHPTDVSRRSVQRRFVETTGLTQNTIRQIERARRAMTLLQQGVAILDVVHEAGYYDQPHLTRSLKRWLGQTPAQIVGAIQTGQLSFLYKTLPVFSVRIGKQTSDREQPEQER
ncbi:MAG TPA: helix-turn-helix domain-containing protein [Thermomicrobiales bacterium]|jgi:AraC-like DNA-binding protein